MREREEREREREREGETRERRGASLFSAPSGPFDWRVGKWLERRPQKSLSLRLWDWLPRVYDTHTFL